MYAPLRQLIQRAFETYPTALQFRIEARGVKLSGPVDRIGLKTKITESGTDLNTILRYFLSFRTVVTSRNIIAFKIFFPGRKIAFRVTDAPVGLAELAALRS